MKNDIVNKANIEIRKAKQEAKPSEIEILKNTLEIERENGADLATYCAEEIPKSKAKRDKIKQIIVEKLGLQ